jgi:WD40 repeat protein
VWDAQTSQEPLTLKGHTEEVNREVYSVAFSPDGTRLASGTDGGTLKVWLLDRLLEQAARKAGPPGATDPRR